MKKIITVLFAVLAIISIIYNITILFNNTKVLFDNISEERVASTDISYKEFDGNFQNKPIEDIIDYFNACVKYIEEYELTFYKRSVEPLDKYAKKYNIYYIGNFKWVRCIVKLNDKEQLEITYNIRAK